MAKVTMPLGGFSASGSVGKSLVYGSRLGVNVVRRHSVPINRQTDDQAEVRTKLAIPGKTAKVCKRGATSDCTLIIDMSAVTSAGQTWNSEIAKQMLGTALGNFDADQTEYGTLDAPTKVFWDTAGAAAGLVNFELNYGAYGPVTSAEQLYHLAKAAYRAGAACAGTDPVLWIEATINAFVADLNDEV